MFKKTKIAAVTAAVLGVSAMALTSNVNAETVTVGENGAAGEVLVFPYYNVNNGFATSFNIINTTDDYKAIKVRFRESNTSNDVLDFNLYMSPNDMWTMGLSKTANGGVLMTTTDKSCTQPIIPAGGKEFIGAAVYDSVSEADVREGYLEVIEMGIIKLDAKVTVDVDGNDERILIVDGVVHENGVPVNCDVIAAAWGETKIPQVAGDGFNQGGAMADPLWDTDYYGVERVRGLDAPTGGIAGSSVLIDTVNIAGFVVEPVSISGYSTVAQHYLPSDTSFYLLPSLASGSTDNTAAINDDGTEVVGNVWDPVARDFGLDDPNLAPNTSVASGVNPMPVANAMLVTGLANQYFVAGETSTDWVVAAPMRKHAIYNDYQYTSGDGYDDADDTKDIKVNEGTDPYWKYLGDKNNDVEAEFSYYDREEKVASIDPGDFSPPIQGETIKVPFEREVNILALTSGGSNPSVLGSDNAQTVTMDSGFVTGWGEFDFSDYDLNAPRFNTWVDPTGGDMATIGAPLAGFAAARGTVKGQNLGETFPMIVERTRTAP